MINGQDFVTGGRGGVWGVGGRIYMPVPPGHMSLSDTKRTGLMAR